MIIEIKKKIKLIGSHYYTIYYSWLPTNISI